MVRTQVTAEKLLQGLLALGVIVLLEGELTASTRGSVSAGGYDIVDVLDFADADDLLRHLEESGIVASRNRRSA